jgi:homoserine O-acetyltransferase
MGGMTCLEWSLSTPPSYVKNIIPIATSAYQGAWGISWGQTQRRAIYADATFNKGHYDPVPSSQPQNGLGTARMIAMLTYRSHSSFEARFGRKPVVAKRKTPEPTIGLLPSPPESDVDSDADSAEDEPAKYSAQGYLEYQADKFLTRFDANCYIHLTKKMDTHDITRGRVDSQNPTPTQDDLRCVLRKAPPKALIIGVESDVLFPISQQEELARHLPDAKFMRLKSEDGHDGFLLEFDTLNEAIREHLQDIHPWVYEGPPNIDMKEEGAEHGVVNSVFGEAEGVEF